MATRYLPSSYSSNGREACAEETDSSRALTNKSAMRLSTTGALT